MIQTRSERRRVRRAQTQLIDRNSRVLGETLRGVLERGVPASLVALLLVDERAPLCADVWPGSDPPRPVLSGPPRVAVRVLPLDDLCSLLERHGGPEGAARLREPRTDPRAVPCVVVTHDVAGFFQFVPTGAPRPTLH